MSDKRVSELPLVGALDNEALVLVVQNGVSYRALSSLFKGADGDQGALGPVGPQGVMGVGLNRRGVWAATTYSPGDYVFSQGSVAAVSAWALKEGAPYASLSAPHLDSSKWVELAVVAGPMGLPGVDGEGVPSGGTTGQILVKVSGSDFATMWGDLPAPVPQLNLIMNGDMSVDRRSLGALISPSQGYSIDRWRNHNTGLAAYSHQQVLDAPAAFNYSLKHTITLATVSAASDIYRFEQGIPGSLLSELEWGTPSAKSCTLSFYVKSSVAGTYAVAMRNPANTLSIVSTYTISTPNVWEKKTVTFVGSTGGVWGKGKAVGGYLTFDQGSGSTKETANPLVWQAGNFFRTAGCVRLTETNGATYQLTGVKLEKGDAATEFVQRLNEELLCSEYFQRSSGLGLFFNGQVSSTASYTANQLLPTRMRAIPTVTALPVSATGFAGATGTVSATDGSVSEQRTATLTLVKGTFNSSYTLDADY